MQYPMIFFSEYKINSDPTFFPTKSNDEYCIFTIYRSFKNGENFLKDTAIIQCFGDECERMRFLLKKHTSLKNIPVDVIAERIPYEQNGSMEYTHRAMKISISSVYYMSNSSNSTNTSHTKEGKNPIPEKGKELLTELERDPFSVVG